jgi:hypothetical protein
MEIAEYQGCSRMMVHVLSRHVRSIMVIQNRKFDHYSDVHANHLTVRVKY